MKRVVIGLSGGVDSSVAAALLKKEGYEVIGITFKFTESFDETDAVKVAEKLEIEHHVIDYRKEFKEQVIGTFLNDYKKGITPNPCVLCNKKVKLNFLYEQMIKFNCDYMATGHYARIEDDRLFRGRDKKKDQSYFLCEVPKNILSKLLLPLEKIEKEETRKIAEEFGMEVATKKDSTDVCFITKTFREYIASSIKSIPGDIIEINTNKKIGKHNGLSNYTIGQRRGLNIGGTADRVFVVGKDMEKNILYVTIGNDDNLISDSCIIENVNWISDIKKYNCHAEFRYHSTPIAVELEEIEDNKILIKYPEGVKSVTPGQACVFYNGEECLGGGIIKEVRKNNEKLWYL